MNYSRAERILLVSAQPPGDFSGGWCGRPGSAPAALEPLSACAQKWAGGLPDQGKCSSRLGLAASCWEQSRGRGGASGGRAGHTQGPEVRPAVGRAVRTVLVCC